MKRFSLLTASAALLALASCGGKHTEAQLTKSGLDPQKFVDTVAGKPTALYTLTNAAGMEVCITNYGGRIVSLMAPGNDGKFYDVVLGFDSIAAYYPENNKSDFGAAIGRYANRIDHGKLTLDGQTIQLPVNNFGHTLHGGPDGWQYKIYDADMPNDSTLILSIDSPDGDNGFPGNVKASVTYVLTSDNQLDITYKATTDKPTVINMTNHSYFNLSGDPTKSVEDQLLTINAAGFTPVDSTYMTTGEITPVAGTPFDFNTAKTIGRDIAADDIQLKNGNGYDHNWVLSTNGDITIPAAEMSCPETGVKLTVYTTEPGIQFYSGNFLDGTVTGKRGIVYKQRTGGCLETQKYPDSPNKPQWPSARLNPGETYTSRTIFKF